MASAAQLAARQKFIAMVRAKQAGKKGAAPVASTAKKTVKKAKRATRKRK